MGVVVIICVGMVCVTVWSCVWIRSGHGHDTDDLAEDVHQLGQELARERAAYAEMKRVLDHTIKLVDGQQTVLNNIKKAASNGSLAAAFGGK